MGPIGLSNLGLSTGMSGTYPMASLSLLSGLRLLSHRKANLKFASHESVAFEAVAMSSDLTQEGDESTFAWMSMKNEEDKVNLSS